jgi:hypothetical protein
MATVIAGAGAMRPLMPHNQLPKGATRRLRAHPHPDVDLAKSSGQRLAFGDDAVIPLKEPLRRSLRSSSALATATVPTH